MAESLQVRNTRAVLRGPYRSPYCLETCDVTAVPEGSALIQLSHTGLCHGDVYIRDGGGPAPATPLRPLTGGHEGVGRIIAINDPDNRHDSYKVGDPVGIAWRHSVCGTCEPCRNGAENFCSKQVVNGMHLDGTFQVYVAHPLRQLVPLPPGLSLVAACPMLCAGVTAYSALKVLQPVAGNWIAIAGAAGATGHLAIQFAKNVFGLKVVAIDGDDQERMDFCLSLGSDVYISYVKAGKDLAAEVKSKTEGGVNYALVFSPSQSAYQYAGEYTRFRGKIMAIGIGNCSVPLRPVLQKQLQILSNQTGTKAEIQEALQYCQDGKVASRVDRLPFEELNKGLDLLAAGSQVLGKLVIDIRDT